MFLMEVEYEEISLVSYDDAGVSSDISICVFNKACAQYDEVQTGGLSARFYDRQDQRVRHHKQREKEASPPQEDAQSGACTCTDIHNHSKEELKSASDSCIMNTGGQVY
jgi:hypothetical protein